MIGVEFAEAWNAVPGATPAYDKIVETERPPEELADREVLEWRLLEVRNVLEEFWRYPRRLNDISWSIEPRREVRGG